MKLPSFSLEIAIAGGIVILILVIILGVLTSKNDRLYFTLKSKKNRFQFHKKRIKKLTTSNYSAAELKKLNLYVKDFLIEYFNLNYSLTYLELEKKFKEKNEKQYSQFFKQMSNANYSGEEIKSEDIKKLILYFDKLLENYEKAHKELTLGK